MSAQNRTWMIRYPDFSFSRPLPEEELLKKFSAGEMKPQDEICEASGYWFSLQDVKEMKKYFGNIPLDGLFKRVNEDVTQERFAVTAPITLPKDIKAALKAAPTPVMQVPPQTDMSNRLAEVPVHKASPLMKLLLAGLTFLVLVLLFVWFG